MKRTLLLLSLSEVNNNKVNLIINGERFVVHLWSVEYLCESVAYIRYGQETHKMGFRLWMPQLFILISELLFDSLMRVYCLCMT